VVGTDATGSIDRACERQAGLLEGFERGTSTLYSTLEKAGLERGRRP